MTRDGLWSRLTQCGNDDVPPIPYKTKHVGSESRPFVGHLSLVLILAIISALCLMGILGIRAFTYATQNMRWAINGSLERAGIPKLPASAKVLGHEQGDNMFHAWFYIKVSMDEKSIREYESALHFEKLVLGDEKGMVRIVDIRSLSDQESRDAEEKGVQLQDLESEAPWWDTMSITNGAMYRHEDSSWHPGMNIVIYVDHGRNLIYIHWDS